jgi:hypothetical protein
MDDRTRRKPPEPLLQDWRGWRGWNFLAAVAALAVGLDAWATGSPRLAFTGTAIALTANAIAVRNRNR